jgi:hypothetical protein
MRLGFGLLVLLALGCARPNGKPAFLLRDDRRSNQVVAVFIAPQKLRQHNLTAAQYETLLRRLSDATLTAATSLIAEMLGASGTPPASSTPQVSKTDHLLSPEAFQDLLAHTKLEVWRMNPDGTHEVLQVIRPQCHQ